MALAVAGRRTAAIAADEQYIVYASKHRTRPGRYEAVAADVVAAQPAAAAQTLLEAYEAQRKLQGKERNLLTSASRMQNADTRLYPLTFKFVIFPTAEAIEAVASRLPRQILGGRMLLRDWHAMPSSRDAAMANAAFRHIVGLQCPTFDKSETPRRGQCIIDINPRYGASTVGFRDSPTEQVKMVVMYEAPKPHFGHILEQYKSNRQDIVYVGAPTAEGVKSPLTHVLERATSDNIDTVLIHQNLDWNSELNEDATATSRQLATMIAARIRGTRRHYFTIGLSYNTPVPYENAVQSLDRFMDVKSAEGVKPPWPQKKIDYQLAASADTAAVHSAAIKILERRSFGGKLAQPNMRPLTSNTGVRVETLPSKLGEPVVTKVVAGLTIFFTCIEPTYTGRGVGALPPYHTLSRGVVVRDALVASAIDIITNPYVDPPNAEVLQKQLHAEDHKDAGGERNRRQKGRLYWLPYQAAYHISRNVVRLFEVAMAEQRAVIPKNANRPPRMIAFVERRCGVAAVHGIFENFDHLVYAGGAKQPWVEQRWAFGLCVDKALSRSGPDSIAEIAHTDRTIELRATRTTTTVPVAGEERKVADGGGAAAAPASIHAVRDDDDSIISFGFFGGPSSNADELLFDATKRGTGEQVEVLSGDCLYMHIPFGIGKRPVGNPEALTRQNARFDILAAQLSAVLSDVITADYWSRTTRLVVTVSAFDATASVNEPERANHGTLEKLENRIVGVVGMMDALRHVKAVVAKQVHGTHTIYYIMLNVVPDTRLPVTAAAWMLDAIGKNKSIAVLQTVRPVTALLEK